MERKARECGQRAPAASTCGSAKRSSRRGRSRARHSRRCLALSVQCPASAAPPRDRASASSPHPAQAGADKPCILSDKRPCILSADPPHTVTRHGVLTHSPSPVSSLLTPLPRPPLSSLLSCLSTTPLRASGRSPPPSRSAHEHLRNHQDSGRRLDQDM